MMEGKNSMFKYTVKRLGQSLITVLIIVTIVFLLLRMLLTDYYYRRTVDEVHRGAETGTASGSRPS